MVGEVARDSAEYILGVALRDVTTNEAVRRTQPLLTVEQSSDRVGDGGLSRTCSAGKEAHLRGILRGITKNIANLSDDSFAGPRKAPLLLHVSSASSIGHVVQVNGFHCVPHP